MFGPTNRSRIDRAMRGLAAVFVLSGTTFFLSTIAAGQSDSIEVESGRVRLSDKHGSQERDGQNIRKRTLAGTPFDRSPSSSKLPRPYPTQQKNTVGRGDHARGLTNATFTPTSGQSGIVHVDGDCRCQQCCPPPRIFSGTPLTIQGNVPYCPDQPVPNSIPRYVPRTVPPFNGGLNVQPSAPWTNGGIPNVSPPIGIQENYPRLPGIPTQPNSPPMATEQFQPLPSAAAQPSNRLSDSSTVPLAPVQDPEAAPSPPNAAPESSPAPPSGSAPPAGGTGPQFGQNVASSSSFSQAGTGQGARTPMFGRVDSSNRLNIFDNNSAIPRSRFWVSGYAIDGFRSHANFSVEAFTEFQQRLLVPPPHFTANFQTLEGVANDFEGASGDIVDAHDEQAVRFGVEWAFTEKDSLIFQGQYVAPIDVNDPVEDFTNPLIMYKRVLSRAQYSPDTYSVFSSIIGVSPESSSDRGAIDDPGARFLPGLLYYENLSANNFAQVAGQWGMGSGTETFDWAFSLGSRFWHTDAGSNSRLQAVVGQAEIMGKHVTGDGEYAGPFGYSSFNPNLGTPGPVFVYDEPDSVIDVTLGLRLLLKNDAEFSIGYSFPISGPRVKDHELMLVFTQGIR